MESYQKLFQFLAHEPQQSAEWTVFETLENCLRIQRKKGKSPLLFTP